MRRLTSEVCLTNAVIFEMLQYVDLYGTGFLINSASNIVGLDMYI